MTEAGRLPEAQRAVVAVLGAADRLRRCFAEILEPRGITFQQYNVLRILRGAGGEGLPTMEVRERMIEQAPGITGLLDRLEQKKLVQRTPSPSDRREVRCRVARSGVALLRRIDDAMDAADRAAFERLDRRQVRTLTRLLDRVGRD